MSTSQSDWIQKIRADANTAYDKAVDAQTKLAALSTSVGTNSVWKVASDIGGVTTGGITSLDASTLVNDYNALNISTNFPPPPTPGDRTCFNGKNCSGSVNGTMGQISCAGRTGSEGSWYWNGQCIDLKTGGPVPILPPPTPSPARVAALALETKATTAKTAIAAAAKAINDLGAGTLSTAPGLVAVAKGAVDTAVSAIGAAQSQAATMATLVSPAIPKASCWNAKNCVGAQLSKQLGTGISDYQCNFSGGRASYLNSNGTCKNYFLDHDVQAVDDGAAFAPYSAAEGAAEGAAEADAEAPADFAAADDGAFAGELHAADSHAHVL